MEWITNKGRQRRKRAESPRKGGENMLIRLTGFLISLLSSGIGGWLAYGLVAKWWVQYLERVMVVREGGKVVTAPLSPEFSAFNTTALTVLGCLIGFIFSSVLFRTL